MLAAVVPEPLGGAHRDHKAAGDALKGALVEALGTIRAIPVAKLVERRYQKFRDIGQIKRKAGSGG